LALPSLRGRRVLVTGATGFIGSHLALRLFAQGASVRGLTRSAAKGTWLFARGIEIVEGDLTDADSLRRAARGCDLVFNLAAWTGRPDGYEAVHRVVVEGTHTLVEAAIGAGVQRLVHTSSIAVYGGHAAASCGSIDETWPLRATDVYGATKAESEAVVLGRSDRIESCVIRPAQIYGPRGHTWTVLLFDAVKRGLPVLVGGGLGTFHPCYIDNLIDGYVLAAARPEAVGEAFTLVDGTTTWREFVGFYAQMVGRPARSVPTTLAKIGLRLAAVWSTLMRRPLPAAPESLSFVLGTSRFDNGKARRLLGWSPLVSLEEGMRRTEAWLRESGRLS